MNENNIMAIGLGLFFLGFLVSAFVNIVVGMAVAFVGFACMAEARFREIEKKYGGK